MTVIAIERDTFNTNCPRNSTLEAKRKALKKVEEKKSSKDLA
ncbi:hypothetical protein Slin15195_G129730 [Septoria linicola]|uniref:Uncharacterized protein n=1 Tax=Septoria linicola TaxID=215465 RepID=A0A9Q9ER92_9PEZI|nr:hypothetical protein Slin15195_G129730 [Septoria linicola]